MKKVILACVATALVAGSGTAVASSLVTSADIRDHTVQGRDIARNTITHANIKNNSILSEDIRNGHVTREDLSRGVRRLLDKRAANVKRGRAGKDGRQGPQGPAGKDGGQGPQGPAGRDGVTGYETVAPPSHPTLCEDRYNDGSGIVANTDCRVNTPGFHDITVHCPAGDVAVSGGAETLNESQSSLVTLHGTHSAAIEDQAPYRATAWEVEFTIASSPTEPNVQASVLCMTDTSGLPG